MRLIIFAAGIAFIVLSVAFAYVAIRITFVSPEISIDDPSGLGVSRMVGAFLPFLVTLTIGVYLVTRKSPRQNS
jgi:hypothetical protein